MTGFILDPRLENDSVFLCDLQLCHLRLHRNAAFPWLMLIPKRAEAVEILDLKDDDQDRLWDEILFVSNTVQRLFKPKKLNVANLGNIVAQLHVHVIARYEDDPAWPNPVWNSGISRAYEAQELEARVKQLQAAFSL